jgi:ATP phosphoribosyltransferase regulatory subunit
LQRQSRPDVSTILSALPAQRAAFNVLLDSRGDPGVIERAERGLGTIPEVKSALATLQSLVQRLGRTLARADISVDLSDLRGYRYHTGTVFNAYTPGYGRALAQGGRYDEIGKAFGRARSATGFSADLRQLLRYGESTHPVAAILAPAGGGAALDAEVARLRAEGERVIRQLPGEDIDQLRDQCDRRLVESPDGWRVEALNK